jgi:predicted DsbA family dithiol-disulfide isomerase
MDISDKNVLRAIAMDAGVDEEEVNEWLNSDLGGSEVDDEIVSVRETFGDGGVPVFFIQGKHRVDGAQDPMEFMEIFEQVKNEEQ